MTVEKTLFENFVEWNDLAALPSVAGVYAVQEQEKIIYVGQAINLAKRWKDHHLRVKLQYRQGIRIFWAKVEEKHSRLDLEKVLIKQHNPELNFLGVTKEDDAGAIVELRNSKGELQELFSLSLVTVVTWSETSGYLLKEARVESGLTLQQLADLTGENGQSVTRQYIHMLEQGNTERITTDLLVALSKALEIPDACLSIFIRGLICSAS